jgi:outer membrane protein assembly factor BamA
MIPAIESFMSGTSGTISLDYSNSTGSGNTISYQHKINTSSDFKVSYTSTIGTKTDFEKQSISLGVNFSSENSWGNTATSDATTTADTGITISRYAISSNNGYAFFPTLYTTLDGTIKLAHAVDPLGSSSGRGVLGELVRYQTRSRSELASTIRHSKRKYAGH